MKLSTIKKALVLTFGLSAAMAMAEPFKVVTTFTVIQDIAQNVAGDKATVESITKPVLKFTIINQHQKTL